MEVFVYTVLCRCKYFCLHREHTYIMQQTYLYMTIGIYNMFIYTYTYVYIYIYWHESTSNTPSCLTPFKHRPVLFVWWRYFIAQGSKSMGWRSAWPPLWMPSADAWRVKDFWAPRGIGSNGSLPKSSSSRSPGVKLLPWIDLWCFIDLWSWDPQEI